MCLILTLNYSLYKTETVIKQNLTASELVNFETQQLTFKSLSTDVPAHMNDKFESIK